MEPRTALNLSRNDSSVLGALFDPEASLNNSSVIDSKLPEFYDDETLDRIRRQEKCAVMLINDQRPTAESIHTAIGQLNEIIAAYPEYASAWNNRAQATRMLFDVANPLDHPERVRSVYNDLSQAIKLATPNNSLGIVSSPAAKVLSSAHTHRGYLLWRASRPEAVTGMLDAVIALCGLGKDQLEELASRDFSFGGRYGNQTAQQLAVKTNPYAKLCGSIVREAMQKEIAEFNESLSFKLEIKAG